MPPDQPRHLDPKQILTSRRIGAAIGALADPHRSPTDQTLHLDEAERHGIRHSLRRSAHPLAGFADGLLDQWGDLADDDRVAGLLLFAEIVNSPRRHRSLSPRRRRGVER
jgi:hypothetical protein